ncbi:MAG: hypothetical protein HPY59_16185 [Anaerolineae bacterium]|nr:hypothetical protein [Anaerolineae bacterium]
MKKFFVILVLLIIFIFCAVFGFAGAKSTWQTFYKSLSPQGSTAASSVNTIQHNFLVIRVDDLQSSQPALLSAWIFFTTFTDPPYMIMKILYPNPRQDGIASSFSIDADGKLSPQFEQEIKKLNFPWDGHLILDNEGLQKINGWILEQPLELPPYDPQNMLDGFTTYVNDSRQWAMFCQNLPGMAQRQNTLLWREVTPTHMRTNLDFETMILLWDYMTHSSAPPYCEVIPWG